MSNFVNRVLSKLKNIEEVILYSSEGSKEEIILNDSVSNYDYIEIFYRYGAAYHSSVKVYNANNKTIDLIGSLLNQDTQRAFIAATNLTASNNKLTPLYFGEYDMSQSKFVYTINRIFIHRVVGYNKKEES